MYQVSGGAESLDAAFSYVIQSAHRKPKVAPQALLMHQWSD